jgi:hypothetical protein
MISTQASSMDPSDNIGHTPQLIYARAFKILQTQYEGTDQVLDYIHKIINQLRLEASSSSRGITDRQHSRKSPPQLAPIVFSTTLNRTEESAVVIYNFAHCPPGEYVRISKTIDVSLATGRFPDRADLPTALQSFKPSIDTRLYSSVALRRGSEVLPPKRDQVHTSHQSSTADGAGTQSLLGELDGWDIPAFTGDCDSSPAIHPDDSALVLQPTHLDPFCTSEGLSMFSSNAVVGDLDTLFPLESAIDAADGASDETIMNLFPYD